MEEADTEGSAAGLGKPIPEEEDNEGYEETHTQRIAAKIVRIGGMRTGMLPTQLSILVSTLPPLFIPVLTQGRSDAALNST